MKTVYLNIGSNRGNRHDFILNAISRLALHWPQAVIRRSPFIESEAWGYESSHPFLNIGIAADFPDSQLPDKYDILRVTQAVELEVSADSPHRNPDGSYRDRDIDIDIIHIDGIVSNDARLVLPHPRAEARPFVMEPMRYLCPGWHPAQCSASHLKKTIADMGRDTIEQFHAKAKMPVTVVLDNIRSLNNIGSIFRTADAFTVHEIVLCGISATPPSPEIHKTALGAEESVAWRYFETTAQAIQSLRNEGWTIACLEQVHGSVELQRFTPRENQKIALVAGNEVQGVDPAIVAEADVYIEIPQGGTKHSLNVAVSTAIALWQLYSIHISRP